MNKLFITGGAGFIGSAFVRMLLDEAPGYEIINFDALTYAGNLDNLDNLDAKRHRSCVCGITEKNLQLIAI